MATIYYQSGTPTYAAGDLWIKSTTGEIFYGTGGSWTNTGAVQDWAAFSDQAYLATTDTMLVRTGAGAGAEVPGSAFVAQRTGGGSYIASGVLEVTTSVIVGDNTNGFGRLVPTTSGMVIQSGSLNSGSATVRDVILSNMYGAAGGVTFRGLIDNTAYLGSGTYRFNTVYASTGTINTSDEKDKVWRGAASDAELRAARRIIGELGFFQYKDAVAEKGEAARYHFGARAQRVWAIMADEGLVDPIGADGKPGATPYAFLCWDEWDFDPGQPATADEFNEADEIVRPGQPFIPLRHAGFRYGLRTDQLALFLIAAQEQRLATLEAAL